MKKLAAVLIIAAFVLGFGANVWAASGEGLKNGMNQGIKQGQKNGLKNGMKNRHDIIKRKKVEVCRFKILYKQLLLNMKNN